MLLYCYSLRLILVVKSTETVKLLVVLQNQDTIPMYIYSDKLKTDICLTILSLEIIYFWIILTLLY